MKSEWKIKPITEIVEFNPKHTVKKGSVLPYVEMAAVPEHNREVAYFQEREFKGGGSKFQNGDTLFSRITPCLQNGKTSRVSGLDETQVANGSTEFIVMSAKDYDNDKDFVYYLSLDKEFRKYAEGRMEGTTGRQRVSWQALAEYEMPIPPKNTRKKIAHILSTLDDKIELNRKMNQTLEVMAQALFKSWFVDFDPVHVRARCQSEEELEAGAKELGIPREILELFPGVFVESEMGMIPEGWEVKSIYDVANIVYGAPFSSKQFNDTQAGKPLIRIRDLKTFNSQHWTEEEHVKGTLITAGDLLIGMDAEFTPTIWQGIDGWLNQRVLKVVPLNGTYTAYHYFSLKPKMQFFEKANVGTTVIHLGKKDIDTIRLLLPSQEILKQSASILEPLFQQLVHNSIYNRSLQKTRDTLLPKLLSGELGVSKLKIAEEN